MGGGGFTMEPNNPLLDDFVLSLTDAKAPRVLFLPTASGDTTVQINAFKARFADRLCTPEHLSLFRLQDAKRPLEEIVLEQDIIYVGGGSMRNLLAIWHAHALDELLVAAWRAGTVLAGLSAGAMCWFQGGVTRSSGPPEPLAGLGLLEGSLTVHADGEPERLPVWLANVPSGIPARGLGSRRRRRAALLRAWRCDASSARARAPAPSASTRSPASSCATGSTRSCSETAKPARWAASMRLFRNSAACTACGAASARAG